jgi:hypothetical protein
MAHRNYPCAQCGAISGGFAIEVEQPQLLPVE